jgi:alkylation response protein AidB-like acyl-CoA dehydrogenase
MEFTFSDEQVALRDSVRAYLSDRGMAYVRGMWEDDRGFTADVWDQMVGLGWTGLLVPEEHGGLGLGLVDLAVVQEEMGRACFTGPFLSSAVLATLAARRLDLGDRLGSLASGAARGTIGLEEMGHGDPVDRVRARAIRKSGRWTLHGVKLVPDGHTADWVLVAARTQEGLRTFALESPDAELQPSWDGGHKVARLDLDGRAAEPVGPDGDHTAHWRRIADDAGVAIACELVGVAEQAYELAVEYAKQRVQFGRPIATFQAIKHKAVDMLHRVTLARVGAHYAAWASDVDAPVREEAAAMAKADAAEGAIFVTGESIQVHGGVGFTWDCDAHFYYRRAKQLDLLLGYQGWHRRRLADLVIASG